MLDAFLAQTPLPSVQPGLHLPDTFVGWVEFAQTWGSLGMLALAALATALAIVRFYSLSQERKGFVVSSIATFLTGTALNALINDRNWILSFLVVTGTVLVVLYYGWPEKYNHKVLEAGLVSFLRVLNLHDAEEDEVRCAMWVRDHRSKNGKEVWQVTNYVPGRTRGRGKRLVDSQGIVGRAFRLGRSTIISIRDEQQQRDFEDELLEKWGFNKDEAARLSKDRRAYLAVPIKSRTGPVIAVIYCDGKDPDTFGDQDRTLQAAESMASMFEPLVAMMKGDSPDA